MKNSKLLLLAVVALLLAVAVAGSWFVFEYAARAKPAPPSTEDTFILGQYYFNHGDKADGTYDLKKARKYFSAAIEADPSANLAAWHQLGRIDFLEGEFDAAIYKFQKQLQYFDDQLPNVYYMLGLTYGYKARTNGNTSDWEKAEENFLNYLGHDSGNPWASVDLSWVYFSQGKYDDMIPLLAPVVEENPNNPWVLNMYGLAILNTQGKEKAREYFERAYEEVMSLTEEDWGKAYPGNDPEAWGQGLEEFRRAIKTNLDLSLDN